MKLTKKRKNAFERLFKYSQIFKIEYFMLDDYFIGSDGYKEAVCSLYVARVASHCEAAYFLAEKDMFSEAWIILRSAFEASLNAYYLMKNPNLITKYREHANIQKYIELLEIRQKELHSEKVYEQLKRDLRNTKRRLGRLKHYDINRKSINDIGYLIRLIGSTPVKIHTILKFIKEYPDQSYFRNIFGGNLDRITLFIYGYGSNETHGGFHHATRLITRDVINPNLYYYISVLMHSSIVAMEELGGFGDEDYKTLKKYLRATF